MFQTHLHILVSPAALAALMTPVASTGVTSGIEASTTLEMLGAAEEVVITPAS